MGETPSSGLNQVAPENVAALHRNRDHVRRHIARAMNIDVNELGTDPKFGMTPGWDSLGHMDLIVAIESALGTEIELEQVPLLTSESALVEYLDTHNLHLNSD